MRIKSHCKLLGIVLWSVNPFQLSPVIVCISSFIGDKVVTVTSDSVLVYLPN